MTASSLPEFVALERPESLADRAYRVVREQIAAGGLQPGQRLTERGLAARLQVSPTPVREALRRLEQDRLVERLGPREMRVVEHSQDGLREIAYTEVVLRALAARFATDKMSDQALDRMDAIVQALHSGATSNTTEQQLALARQFDEELVAAADSHVLQALVDSMSVFGRGHRLRTVQNLRGVDPAADLRRIEEHREILLALRARDPDRVEQLVRTQLVEAMHYLLPPN